MCHVTMASFDHCLAYQRLAEIYFSHNVGIDKKQNVNLAIPKINCKPLVIMVGPNRMSDLWDGPAGKGSGNRM